MAYDQFNAFNDMNYLSCDNSSQGLFFYGYSIFKETIFQSATASRISMAGWFNLRGYYDTFYNIYTMLENGIVQIQVDYNVIQKKIKSNLLTSIDTQDVPFFSRNLWYLIITEIESTNTQTSVQTSIRDFIGNTFVQTPQITLSRKNPFNKQQIKISFGNPIPIYGIHNGCLFAKSVYIYWEQVVVNQFSYYNNVGSLDMRLIWIFDFFYTGVNPNFAINIAVPMNYLSMDQSRTLDFTIEPTQVFLTDYINTLIQKGITISFHFKIPTTFATIELLSFLNINQSLIISLNGSKIMLNNKFIDGVDFTKWNQITLVLKYLTNFNAFMIVSGFESNVQLFPLSSIISLCQLQFGSSSNISNSIQLRYLRVYEGTFLTSPTNNNNCLIQASRDVKTCLICSSGYLLSYQNKMSCQSPSSLIKDTDVNKVADWIPNRTSCPEDMIRSPSSNKCICRYQYYNSDNTCIKCPNYCRGCYDQNNCIEKDILRDLQGKCPSGYFDDGYLCLNNRLTILSKQNYMKWFPTLDLPDNCALNLPANDYYIKNIDLKLTNSDSIFYSFTYKSNLPKFNRGCINFLRDGNNEVISIMYIQSSEPAVEFVNNGIILHTLQVNNDEPIWVGVWTNFKKAVFVVHTNAQLIYKELNISINITFNDPYLCIGPCPTLHDNNYNCGSFTFRPLIFIYNILNPIDNINEIQNLINLESSTIALFTSNVQDTSVSVIQDTNNSSLLLELKGSNYSIDNKQGFAFTSQNYGQIDNINFTNGLPTFSCKIKLDKLQFSISIFSYDITLLASPQKVEYFIVPYSTRALIRICLFKLCQDTKYSMLNMLEDNSLYIITRKRSPFSSDICYYEFEVVCNYQRESVKFINNVCPIVIPNSSVFIAKQGIPAGNYSIHMNFINLEQGDGSYYFDYQENERCFLFKNIQSMECLLYKQNFVTYKNIFISREECLSYTQIFKRVFKVNEDTKECIDTQINTQKCKDVDIDSPDLKCLSCLYEGAILTQDCICPKGSYADEQYQKCLPCSKQCESCDMFRDNCISCFYENQYPPSCECGNLNQYLDDNLVCQDCSPQCNSCQFDKGNCIECAINRINPPLCECNRINYQEQNQICQLLSCDYKCSSCLTNTFNCFSCKSGRVDPPNCGCDVNHYEDSFGNCVRCPDAYFYDSISNSCKPCEQPCLQCVSSKDNCIFCEQGFILKRNTCYCSDNYSAVFLQQGISTCLEDMDVSLEVKLKNSFYQLVFQFDYSLKEFQISSNSIKEYLILNIPEIPSDLYLLQDPIIDDNQLTLTLIVKKSFQAQQASVLFKKNQVFISRSERYVLNSRYKTIPLNFQLGPMLLSEEYLDQKELGQVIDKLKNENQNILKMMQNLSILILKYVALALIILLLKLFSYLRVFHKSSQIKIEKIMSRIKQQINQENETNLLIITVCILVQFQVIDQSQWLIRYGYYFSIAFLLMLFGTFVLNYHEVNSREKRSKFLFSNQFTNRLSMSQKYFDRNYFVFQLLKKYIVIIILFLFDDLPICACVFSGIVFLSSLYYTFKSKPYKNKLSRAIKLLSDAILFFTWAMHTIIIVLENKLLKQTIFSEELLQIYINLGTIVIITLLLFNLIYILDYVYKLYFQVIKLIQRKKYSKEQLDFTRIDSFQQTPHTKKNISFNIYKNKKQIFTQKCHKKELKKQSAKYKQYSPSVQPIINDNNDI